MPKISISLPREQYEALSELAKNKGMTTNEYIKQLLMHIAELYRCRKTMYRIESEREELYKLLDTVMR